MKKLLLFAIFLIASKNFNAQINKTKTVFDEQYYINEARSLGDTPEEIKWHVEHARKEFIEGKQNATPNFKTNSTYTYNLGCTNIDFETGNAMGWAVSSGSNPIVNGSCNLLGCCGGAITNYTVMSNGVVDPNVPTFTINSVFGGGGPGGNYFIKINDAIPNLAMERVSQSFKVTANNNLFVYAFLLVFDGTGHVCCDQPFYNLTLQDTLGNLIIAPTMPNYSVTVPGVLCPAVPSLSLVTGSLMNTPGTFSYSPWIISAIDLTPYIGNAVNISVTAGDCTQGGHAGYMYYDAMCAPMTCTVQGLTYTLNPMNSFVIMPTNTVVAPNGFNYYQWNGPTGTINSQTLVTSTIGSYTLSLGGIGYSGYSQKVFNLWPLSISEQSPLLGAINLFPNPTNNEFYIDNLPLRSVYSVTDVSGKLIINKTMNSSTKAKIDISNLDNGIYFVKVETEHGSKNFKIVKE